MHPAPNKTDSGDPWSSQGREPNFSLENQVSCIGHESRTDTYKTNFKNISANEVGIF